MTLPDDIPESKRFSRYGLSLAMNKFFETYNLEGKKILTICGIPEYLPPCECINTEFPNVDLTKLPYADNSFDLVISNFVIEHVLDPFKAIAEKYRVLKTGGVAITVTNGCYAYHGLTNNGDYWRFTTDGMREITKQFSKTHVDFLGNGELVKLLVDCKGEAWHGPFSTDDPTVLAKCQYKDPLWQITVWAISEK